MIFKMHPCGNTEDHSRHWVSLQADGITYAGYECPGHAMQEDQ